MLLNRNRRKRRNKKSWHCRGSMILILLISRTKKPYHNTFTGTTPIEIMASMGPTAWRWLLIKRKPFARWKPLGCLMPLHHNSDRIEGNCFVIRHTPLACWGPFWTQKLRLHNVIYFFENLQLNAHWVKLFCILTNPNRTLNKRGEKS